MSLSLRYKLLRQASSAQRAQECRLSGMEAPENLKDDSDVEWRRQPGRAVYRLKYGKTPTTP